jgi:lipopolysaccharide/colanic/teichoic acid biosynthesis glycosyltransferase
MVDLSAAKAAVRRHRSEVLVFGAAQGEASPRYAESVVVGESGEVIRCVRHYSDSPDFTDLWSGEASFLVASGDNTVAVVKHVLARGWGLDSIGAMTRRFDVHWASTDCVLSLFAAPSLADPLLSERGSHGDSVRPLRGVSASPTEPTNGRGRKRLSATKARSYVIGDDSGQSVDTDAGAPRSSARGEASASDVAAWLPVPEPGDAPTAGWVYRASKRLLDVTVASAGLVALSPLLLVLGLLVKLTSRGPILFAHKRQGLGGKVFSCWKFRTMCADADALQAKLREQNEVDGPQFKITDDPRLTRIGRLLRDYNLDELPQLLNVLVGQMSLVGPRPSPDKENQFCPPWRRARLSVKPGITGLWQVLRLRDEDQSDFQEWIYYDIEYARHQSLWLDLQILAYTPASMFAPRFVNGFVHRLKRSGICVYSARLSQDPAADARVPA